MLLPIIIIVVATYKAAIAATAYKVAIAATTEFINGFAMDCLYVPTHHLKSSGAVAI